MNCVSYICHIAIIVTHYRSSLASTDRFQHESYLVKENYALMIKKLYNIMYYLLNTIFIIIKAHCECSRSEKNLKIRPCISAIHIWWKCLHPQAIQDVSRFVFLLEQMEKFSITSLAQQWMLCSEWVPS